MKEIKTNLGKVSLSVEKDYWDIDKEYDRLTIVERAGTNVTYISRKPVPKRTSILDREYWIPLGKHHEGDITPYEVVNALGSGSEVAIAQQIVTKEINKLKKQFSSSVEIIQTAISMLSPEQQEAIGIAQQVATIQNQLNGLSLVTCTEQEYRDMILNEEIDENTLYFIEEEEEEEEIT